MAWKKIQLLLVLFSVATLFACTPAAPPTATATSPAPTATSQLPGQINLLATQTQVAGETEAARTSASTSAPFAGETTPPSAPGLTPLPTTDLYEQVGPFKQISLEPAMIAGRVTGLQVEADGSAVVLSESGYSRYQQGQWTGYFTEEIGPLVGIDAAGQAWAVRRDGGTIAAWQGDQWVPFGANEGWITPTITAGMVNGPGGDLWLATGSDVRRFDGSRWELFSPEAMGMPVTATLDVSTFFALMSLPAAGELWVGHCSWSRTGPAGGGGIRKFSQGAWQEVDPAFSNGCITALHAGTDGNIWIGAGTAVQRYNPESQALESIALPEPPSGYRLGSVMRLATSPAGEPWAILNLCTSDGCYAGELLYHRTADGWRPVGEINPAGGQELLFDASGTPWLFSGGVAYRIVGDVPKPIPGLLVQAAAADAQGNIWLVAQSAGEPTLWKQVK